MIPTLASLILCLLASSFVFGQEAEPVRPLLKADLTALQQSQPTHSRHLTDPTSIEKFLQLVDGTPPDWVAVHGTDDHNERLFALNRERDRLREGRIGALGPVTFLWDGELSEYNPHLRGYRVSIGPRMVATSWGLVRFKPENIPAGLVAVPSPEIRTALERQFTGGKTVEIWVAMTGHLIPQESIIYDFAHEEPGTGMVMPVIRIERIDFLFCDDCQSLNPL